jgi:regulator of replication initiation timing
VEQKLRATREEVGDLKTALDSAWAAEKLQKREVHGLRAENEALKVRLRESTERTVAQAEVWVVVRAGERAPRRWGLFPPKLNRL